MSKSDNWLSTNFLNEIESVGQDFLDDYIMTKNSDGMFLRKKIDISAAANVYDTYDDEKEKALEETKRKFSLLLQDNAAISQMKSCIIDNPKERVIILFSAPEKNIYCDLDVPLDMSANDLVIALNNAYSLGVDVSDITQCYLRCKNPIALIKGKKLLGEFGVRDGSIITFDR